MEFFAKTITFFTSATKEITLYSASIGGVIITFSLLRNWGRFRDDINYRIDFLVMFMAALIIFSSLNTVALSFYNGVKSKSEESSEKVYNIFKGLNQAETRKKGFLSFFEVTDNIADKLLFYATKALYHIFYFFRFVLRIIIPLLIKILAAIAPLPCALLMIPETKPITVRYIFTLFALSMLPLGFLLADVIFLQLSLVAADLSGIHKNPGQANDFIGKLANGSSMVVQATGLNIATCFVFALMLAIAGVFCYIFIPIMCFKFFQTGAIGVASSFGAASGTLNTAANIALAAKTGGASAVAGSAGGSAVRAITKPGQK